MNSITFTLVSEGSSDQALIPILRWVLIENLDDFSINANWADFRRLLWKPRTLTGRIQKAIELYPCDVLFVHRDADNASVDDRCQEIEAAVLGLPAELKAPSFIKVVPVRMTEAWLLVNEHAIRSAAGNPHGRTTLDLPHLHEIEGIADPKQVLLEQLRRASELRGRRLKSFNPERERHRITDYMTNFSTLRSLSAFQKLEQDVRSWARPT